MSRASIAVISALVLLLTAVPRSAAADTAPLPASMAAVGDSITQAASTGGSLGADYPQNSWATGTNATVNSHALRLQTLGAPIAQTTYNRSVSGAKVADLPGQMSTVVPLQPAYLTVLIGGNDLCTDTVAQMTSVTDFRSSFASAMSTIASGSPSTYVYVVSIPDVYQLWSLFRNNFWARLVWSSAGICQSLLANPGSTSQADVQRREQVRQRNIAFNTQLAEVCAAHASRCRFDGNAVFNTQLTRSDVSGDYFHPSLSGQARLAQTSWDAGFTWTTTPVNQPPTAGFTASCTGLTCAFVDTSTDVDGTVVAWSWAFGDGAIDTSRNPSHEYATAGTYTVVLTVEDDDRATGSALQTVNVTVPTSDAPVWITSLGGSATASKGNWTATVSVSVAGAGGPVSDATVTGTWSSGGTGSCTTTASGSCTTSSNVNKKTASVTFVVTGVSGPGLVYEPRPGDPQQVTVSRP
ncbi:MAG: PKD domain-containing protein [Chloroflexi bacterium]|nr:PKD domain-containing protein [Chloroflexota bacterium]